MHAIFPLAALIALAAVFVAATRGALGERAKDLSQRLRDWWSL